MDDTHEKLHDSHKGDSKNAVQPLRYRTRALWLLGFYVLLIVVPWVLTCVLAHRPINASSYVRQQGFLNHEVSNMHKWKIAVDVLNAISGVITIPVLSAVLAQAAVLFCQRRKPDETLSLRDMFALADRGWTNASAIWSSIRTRPSMPGGKSSAAFLLPAACLIVLGAIQQPLYQILVRVSTVSVVTCRDIPSWYRFENCTGSQLYGEVGRDLEPAQMANAEYSVMLSRVSLGLASISGHESQPRLWSANTTRKAADDKFSGDDVVPDSLNNWVFQRKANPTSKTDPASDFFVAGIPAGTTTGVLRQHLMRLSSSIQCQEVDPSEFPSQCAGDQPFTVAWEHVLDRKVRICVPGDYTAFPWALNRSRQEHIEELYIDVNDTRRTYEWEPDAIYLEYNISHSIHCTATTTRGYFEMGNDWNDDTYGPLLEQWPDAAHMAENSNDWTDTSRWGRSWEELKPYVPSDVDTSFGGRTSTPEYDISEPLRSWKVPGPLTISALALFGNQSWLRSAADYLSKPNNVSRHDDTLWQLYCRGIPFLELGMVLNASLAGNNDFVYECNQTNGWSVDRLAAGRSNLLKTMRHLLAAFSPASKDRNLDNTENLLTTAIFVANQAFLTMASPEFGPANAPPQGRLIYASPGTAVQKPSLSRTALIVLSVLIGLQLLGLGYLTYYLYRAPSWTDQLDAMAMARIGASLRDRGVLPAIGPVTKEDIAALKTVGGLIGIVEKRPRRDSSTTTFVLPKLAATSSLEAESQWLNPAEQGRGSSISRSTSIHVADTNGSSLDIQRLSPADSGRKSSQDRTSLVVSPNLNTKNDPDAEMQRLNSTEELRGSFEEVSTGVELGIDAPGPILAADVPSRRPHVPGLRRAWKGIFDWRES